jgi:hypothetical protein
MNVARMKPRSRSGAEDHTISGFSPDPAKREREPYYALGAPTWGRCQNGLNAEGGMN